MSKTVQSVRATSQLISGGRVTVPRSARDALGLSDGDYVEIEVTKVAASE